MAREIGDVNTQDISNKIVIGHPNNIPFLEPFEGFYNDHH